MLFNGSANVVYWRASRSEVFMNVNWIDLVILIANTIVTVMTHIKVGKWDDKD